MTAGSRGRVGVFVLAVLAGLESAAGLADARPGTPTDVRASSSVVSNTELPEVHVTFRNTASETVKFWVEWT